MRGIIDQKQGSVSLALVLVATVLAISAGVFLVTDDSNSITGAAVGPGENIDAQKITTCNITLNEDVINIGHDYECSYEHGFLIGTDNITVDCQNHTIKCMNGCNDSDLSGFNLNGKTGVTIQNCKVYDFMNGAKLTNNASQNKFLNNIFERNRDGVDLYNSTANNFTLNEFNNNTFCGFNASGMNHASTETTNFNNIWNNKFHTNGTTTADSSYEACNDLSSYNYWYLEKNCAESNIIGGPCLGGNFWSTYTGTDVTGDGFGDSNIPYTDGDIQAVGIGDKYPLVSPCALPGVASEDISCPDTSTSTTGQGLAIVTSNTKIDCQGTGVFAGMIDSTDAADAQRGAEVVGVNNVTITGCTFLNWTYGIYIQNAYNVVIENSIFHDNNESGIYLDSLSYNVTMRNNTFTNNHNENTQNTGIMTLSSYPSNSEKGNYVQNSTFFNLTYAAINLSGNSDYVTIEGNLIYNNTNGIVIRDSAATTIKNNTFYNNTKGIWLVSASSIASFGTFGSTHNKFTEDNISIVAEDTTFTGELLGEFYEPDIAAIQLSGSSNPAFGQTIIDGGDLIKSSTSGIQIFNATSKTTLSYLNITRVFYAVNIQNSTIGPDYGTVESYLYNNTHGFFLANANNSNFTYKPTAGFPGPNRAYNNTYGFLLQANSSNNTISRWELYDSEYGLRLISSSTNIIFDNNFTNNGIDAKDPIGNFNSFNLTKVSGTNIIDGPNIAGNFWDNYTGADQTGDSIGDTLTPFRAANQINAASGDFWPLVTSPGNASCSELTHTVSLSENLTAPISCFDVVSDSITVDCAGYSIIGNNTIADYAISVSSNNVIIQNCMIQNFSIGINASSATNLTIKNTTIHNVTAYGAKISNSLGLNITNTTIKNGTAAIGLNLDGVNQSVIDNSTIDSFLHGIWLNESDYNNYSSNFITNSTYGILLNSSAGNLLYNNYFNNTLNAQDNLTNSYNTTLNCTGSGNILQEACIGGNFWSDYTGLDDGSGSYPYNESTDGIGDTIVPHNSSNNTYGSTGDELPLMKITVDCGQTITKSSLLTMDISTNASSDTTGNCLIIGTSNITLDLGGYTITGNGSGIGINISNKDGVTIKGIGNITNFTTGIYADPSENLNFTNLVISNTTTAIELYETNTTSIEYTNLSNNQNAIVINDSHHNTLQINNITGNDLGLNIESGTNNTIYDNAFVNTNNAQDDGSLNHFNLSYTSRTSIVGGTSSGGNYWSDYTGKDNGGGSSSPYTTSGDGVGDTQIPYNNSNKLTGAYGGDHLPLGRDQGSATECKTITEDTILTTDISCTTDNGVTINADGITLDCRGKSITGSGSNSGVYIDGNDNIKITNCTITNFEYGIQVKNAANTKIVDDNNITNNDFYGIYIHSANNTNITRNNIINDNNGVYEISAIGTIIENNTINLQQLFYGIYSYGSESLTARNNNMINNYHGIYLVNSDDSNIDSNTINITDKYNLFVHSGSTNAIIRNNTLTGAQYGIYTKEDSNSPNITYNNITQNTITGVYLKDTSSASLEHNSITNNVLNVYTTNTSSLTSYNDTIEDAAAGMQLNNASSAKIMNLTINSSSPAALQITSSNNANITGSQLHGQATITSSTGVTVEESNATELLNISSNSITINQNTLTKLEISSTSSATISSNTIHTTFRAESLSSSTINDNTINGSSNYTAFDFETITSSTIRDNTLKNNLAGIKLTSTSTSNTFYDNWLESNTDGINLTSSTSNTFYNNYIKNTNNINEDGANTWYTTYSCTTPNIVGGPCQAGNFYSDYYGLDDGSNSREEGDGIGDNPASHTVSASSSDIYPLVLYVARTYYSPNDATTAAITATSNKTGTLSNGTVVPNEAQLINYSTAGKDYTSLIALFNESDIDTSTLIINYNTNTTFVNTSGVTNIESNYTVYLYHNATLNGGIHICPETNDLASTNATTGCQNQINVTTFPQTTSKGHRVTVDSEKFTIQNITNTSIAILTKQGDGLCGSNIYHDVTLTQAFECNTSDAALQVQASNITIDLAGFLITGNSSGYGINITGRDGITLKNANFTNFTVAIFVDPSENINITGAQVVNSTTGILLWETNHSTVYQSILLNNTVGLNVTESFNNTIHNNYFNNTINIEERNLAPVQINHFNISKTCSDSFVNIIGGNCTGGNFYSDYTGWDTSPDGVGDTQTPHNSTANIHRSEGDHLPLTSFKQISCGNITADLTLPQSFTEGTNTNDACFTVTTDNITLDCQGYNINGNSSGSAFNITNRQNVTIKDCNINGFEYAIYAENTNISNITNLTITNSTQAIYAITAQNNSITTNTIKNTSVALNLTNSENNTIHNNFINATTLSVWDNGTNWYNISRTCSDNYTNILGHNCTGGNFWADYVGTDNGNGSGTFNATPWNISGDGVGDNELPFNASNNISVNHIGDYLPLLTITSSSSSSSSSGGSSGSSSSGGGGGGSSGGSSGGGGGGGSSSSSSSDTTDTEDTTCTESWICPAWTECENGQQTRTCADENDCGTYNSRPDETRECESEEPAPEPVEEPAPEESHPIIDFITLPSPARTFTITSIALLAGLGTVFGYWEFIKPSARLRRRLRKAQSIVGDESTDALKEHYKGIYKLYMKTSEKNKQNFYANVTKLREHIEEGLKAERLIQKQFESAQNAPDLLSQKKSYLKIYKEYQKLPAKTQEKYYHKIVDLRARLESGA